MGARRGQQVDAAVGGALALQALAEFREMRQVAHDPAIALAAEAAHAMLNVSKKTFSALLAVIDHVEADFELLGNDGARGRGDRLFERRSVDGIAVGLGFEQVSQILWPRQAAGVSGQNPVFAGFHLPFPTYKTCSVWDLPRIDGQIIAFGAVVPAPAKAVAVNAALIMTAYLAEMETDNESALKNVEVEISVVIGRSTMPIHQLLKMGRGAVIELEASVDDPAWIYANNQLIARGEIVVTGDAVGISITDTFGV